MANTVSLELDMLRAMIVADANKILEEVESNTREHPRIKRLQLEAKQKGTLDGMKLERQAYDIACRLAVEELKRPRS